MGPPPAVRPCRTPPLKFVFGCTLMALLVVLQPRDGDRHLSMFTVDISESNKNFIMNNPKETTNKSSTTKPTLLLHMGPPKTSTSFLQCILTNMMDTLALDNFVYLGLHVNMCRKEDTQTSDKAVLHLTPDFPFEEPKIAVFRPTFINELRESLNQGKNAIIVCECFWSYTAEQRQLLIDEFSSNWDVKLILNYRRVYEFLPSAYNQNHKPSTLRHDPMVYPSYTLWPDETNQDGVVGKPQLPFNVDEDVVMKRFLNDMETKGLHPVS